MTTTRAPSDRSTLAALLRERLLAQANLFAALTDHPTLVGSARERALTELLRELVPRRLEVLTGTIARLDETGEPRAASSQVDVMVVDTTDYPTLLRAGDTAIVLPQSVRAVIEVKSDLDKGAKFYDAMEQIGLVRRSALEAGNENGFVTALYSFASPKKPGTLRGWIEDLLAERARRDARVRSLGPDEARAVVEKARAERDAFAALNLPDVIVSDQGAIALKQESILSADGEGPASPRYAFFETQPGASSTVALVDQIMTRLAKGITDGVIAESSASMRLTSAFTLASRFLNVPLEEAADCLPIQIGI